MADRFRKGSKAEVAKELKSQSKAMRGARDAVLALRPRNDRQLACANLIEASARQLDALGMSLDHSIETYANVCRTLFEINLVARWSFLSLKNIDAFIAQTASDEIQVLEGFLHFAAPGESDEDAQHLRNRISQVQSIMKVAGAKASRAPLIKDMAAQAGALEEYDALYKFYCKYVHASAWLINMENDRIDNPQFRNILLVQSQEYAADTRIRVEKFIGLRLK